MRFSRLFNKLLRDDIEVRVYKRKADCEDGELQGDFCGSYLSGSLVPAEIWGSYTDVGSSDYGIIFACGVIFMIPALLIYLYGHRDIDSPFVGTDKG